MEALLELRGEARFTDSGLVRDQHDLAVLRLGLGQISAYLSHLLQSGNSPNFLEQRQRRGRCRGNFVIFRGQPRIARGELAAQSPVRTVTEDPSATSAGAEMPALLSPVEPFALSSSAVTIGSDRPADRRASMTGCRRGTNAVPGRR